MWIGTASTTHGAVHGGSSPWSGGLRHGLLRQQRHRWTSVRRRRYSTWTVQGWRRRRSFVVGRSRFFQPGGRGAHRPRSQERPQRILVVSRVRASERAWLVPKLNEMFFYESRTIRRLHQRHIHKGGRILFGPPCRYTWNFDVGFSFDVLPAWMMRWTIFRLNRNVCFAQFAINLSFICGKSTHFLLFIQFWCVCVDLNMFGLK